jgi:hypothetical protein
MFLNCDNKFVGSRCVKSKQIFTAYCNRRSWFNLSLSLLAGESVHFRGPCIYFATNIFFYGGGVVSPPPNLQTGRPPPVGCPRLLIQYIRSYPSYLEAVSSIRNPRTRHAVVTSDPVNRRKETTWKTKA